VFVLLSIGLKVVVSVARIRDESQKFRSLRTIRYGAMSMGNINNWKRKGDAESNPA